MTTRGVSAPGGVATGAAARRRIAALAAGGAVALAAAIVEYARTDSPAEAGLGLIAGLLAAAVGWLALALPGSTLRGVAIGGLFVAAGISTWTFPLHPVVIWAVLATGGIVFAVWSRPWFAHLPAVPRAGGAWLGLAYWFLGIVGALLVGNPLVAAQRAAYAGVFTLAALAVVATIRRPRRRDDDDPSIGMAAAIIMGIAVLLLAGSGHLFDAMHSTPDSASAQLMRDRFWGGLGLYYHPNSMAGLAVIAALRIGPDPAFPAAQRVAVTGLAGWIVVLSNSRIGFVFALSAAVVHAALGIARARRASLGPCRWPWRAITIPFAVLSLVLVLSGGQEFLLRNRFSGASQSTVSDVTSGRIDTWNQVGDDWHDAGWAEKLFGDARTARAVVTRTDDGAPAGAERLKLNTDNTVVGALRRGGVLGVSALLLGLGLLLWRVVGRRARDAVPVPAWFAIAGLAAVPTIATEDWLLGGTNGAMWIILLASELRLVLGRPPVHPPVHPPAGSGPAG
ncbi:MAG: hypothetical protein HKP61_03925 [Dactylosporangium sp.]|nr:hypothetical protein [Dactylosporangium sp.]NNJ60101.1 hypothetical protein [Dactylosporangium sp.]